MTRQTSNKHKTNSSETELKLKHISCLVQLIENVIKAKEKHFTVS